MNSIEIFRNGTKVKLNLSKTDGVVIGATIRNEHVRYEINYFIKDDYSSKWFDSSEFTVADHNDKSKVTIGFKKQEE